MTTMKVIKRDGTVVNFDKTKIENAIRKAFIAECGNDKYDDILDVMDEVTDAIDTLISWKDDKISVESIQDIVEEKLMESGNVGVAKTYILYREERAKLRNKRTKQHPDISALSDYIHHFKYARYLPDKQRRETYLETSHRCRDMHLKKFCPKLCRNDGVFQIPLDNEKELCDKIRWAWDFVDKKIVLPSMRSMQFGGQAIEDQHCRIYNCSFTLVDRPGVFQEIFYLLLCGCGVGYSVQFPHVNKLPKIKVRDKKLLRHYTIPDSIIGWADSIGVLMDSFFSGYYVEFNYSNIRAQGSPLRISGGKAPGHFPLKTLHTIIVDKLSQVTDRQLRPIECHDIICHIADSVLSGGIRRSSLISLFSFEDEEMLYAKHPGHFEHYGENGQRALANNSAVLVRDRYHDGQEMGKQQFLKIMELNKNNPNGEPGFFFTNNIDYGCNPCGEIGLNPVLNVREAHPKEFKSTFSVNSVEGKSEWEYEESKLTGVAFCNLTEINCAAIKTEEEFYDAAKAATIIGTLQAAYTDMKYLGEVSEQIAKRDALLGVSLTGMMDNPNIALNGDIQQKAVSLISHTNKEIAKLSSINPAKRLTTIKPSGTASLLLGGVASGIHPHHSRRYFRRITANKSEPVVKEFIRLNPQMVEYKPNGDISLIFPVETPPTGLTLNNLPMHDFLYNVFNTYDNWIKPGSFTEDLTHNISCTVCFKEEDYNNMVEMIWANRHRIASMSFIPYMSDKLIPFMPRESVLDEKDEVLWNELVEKYKPIDYTKIKEADNSSSLTMELACSRDDDQCGVATISVEDSVELVENGDLVALNRLGHISATDIQSFGTYLSGDLLMVRRK